MTERPQSPTESGYALLVVVSVLLPMLVLIGAVSSMFLKRNDQLIREIRDARALLAAESGLDEAIYMAMNNTLTSGTPVAKTIGPGLEFVVTPLDLGADSMDNDGDGDVDEPDENLMQVIVTGTHGSTTRRIAGFLQGETNMPTLVGGVTFFGVPAEIAINGGGSVSGLNTNLDGTPGDPAGDGFGFSVVAPNTPVMIIAAITGSPTQVTGSTAAPSVGVAPTFDLNALVAAVQASPDLVVTVTENPSAAMGDASIDDYRKVYRNGDLRFSGTSQGAGILVVTGFLKMADNFRWDGLIVALGEIECSGGSQINGGIIQGPAAGDVKLAGADQIRRSTEALNAAAQAAGLNRWVLAGWQEISRK